MNILQRAAIVGEQFKQYFPAVGSNYTPISTYASDFVIAEPFGADSIKETATTAWKNWHKDYKWATEIVMVLNWLSWYHYEQTHNQELCGLYADLYEEYRDKFYDEFEKNTEACDYFFEMTD